MNANELADQLKRFVEQIKPTNNEHDDAIVKGLPNWFIEQIEEASDMLRRQSDHIVELEKNYTTVCLEVRDLCRENESINDKLDHYLRS